MSRRTGRLYGVGVGPGDPGLITLRAAELIRSADVIAFHGKGTGTSIARRIAGHLFPAEVVVEELVYPVTTGATDHAGGYYGALADFYEECADRLERHLEADRQVVVISEGDPLFYGSFMYVHDLLAPRWPVEVVPGVTSMSAGSAAAATGLCRHEDVLTVLPGTLGVPELARRLADTDAAVVMKLGRTFADVREALRQSGMLDRAVYVERASSAQQRVLPAADVDPDVVPYMSIVVVPGPDTRADSAGRATAVPPEPEPATATGTVHVVGLGPGPEQWLSPEASQVLSQVRHVIGYAPYVERVPQREGLSRHVSGNTVEVDRGRLALDLALGGQDVAVVSGGDAGVFGMATAVLEAADADARFDDVPVHVVPGITAAHAASALVGAMTGGDHALVSLSDRLKPWEVVEQRLRALAAADLVIALYNPRSRSRPGQLAQAQHALLEVAEPQRVVVVARHVGRAEQSVQVTTLGELDAETVDMGCLVLIGSSTTRVDRAGRVWTPRWVD